MLPQSMNNFSVTTQKAISYTERIGNVHYSDNGNNLLFVSNEKDCRWFKILQDDELNDLETIVVNIDGKDYRTLMIVNDLEEFFHKNFLNNFVNENLDVFSWWDEDQKEYSELMRYYNYLSECGFDKKLFNHEINSVKQKYDKKFNNSINSLTQKLKLNFFNYSDSLVQDFSVKDGIRCFFFDNGLRNTRPGLAFGSIIHIVQDDNFFSNDLYKIIKNKFVEFWVWD